MTRRIVVRMLRIVRRRNSLAYARRRVRQAIREDNLRNFWRGFVSIEWDAF